MDLQSWHGGWIFYVFVFVCFDVLGVLVARAWSHMQQDQHSRNPKQSECKVAKTAALATLLFDSEANSEITNPKRKPEVTA